MKSHYGHWLPKKLNLNGIVFGRHIFYYDEHPTLQVIIHEETHVRQYEKCGIVLFLLSYVLQYTWHRLSGKSHDHAYRSITFEIEAFEKENDIWN